MKLLTTKQQQKLVHEIVDIYLIAKDAQVKYVNGCMTQDEFYFPNMERLTNMTIDAIYTLVGIKGLKEITEEYGLGI